MSAMESFFASFRNDKRALLRLFVPLGENFDLALGCDAGF